MTATQNLTSDFLGKVKNELENANWDFEACNPTASYSDCEKAISYLGTQRFSIKKIQSAIQEYYEDYLYNAREEKIRHEYLPLFFAKSIASDLAFNRISKFQKYSSGDFRNVDSKKWYINETVTFTLN